MSGEVNTRVAVEKKEMMLVIYVDDVGIAAKYKKEVDLLVQRLEDQGFKLTREGTFSEFLGIKFEKNNKDNSINMTQKGLILFLQLG